MTTPAARAKVRVVEADGCKSCFASADPRLTFVELVMPRRFPVPQGCAANVAEAERLILCSDCVRTAARAIGLCREPSEDPRVQRLAAAREAALQRLTEADTELARLQGACP